MQGEKRQKKPGIASWLVLVSFLYGLGPSCALAAAPDVAALPQGGQVVAGAASIASSGSQMTVTQNSASAVINWNRFDVGAQAQVVFNQPDAASRTLNRVLSSDPSRIYGSVTGNGQLFFINPNGVIVGKGARIEAGGVVASTMDVDTDAFMGGAASFSRNGATGALVNEGTIAAAPEGYVALLGAKVTNAGTIDAPQGRVVLAAGDKVTLPLTSSGLIGIAIDPATIETALTNEAEGVIRAEDGQIYLEAEAAGILATEIVNKGQIEAGTVTAKTNGALRLHEGSAMTGGKLALAASMINGDGLLQATGSSSEIRLEADDINYAGQIRADNEEGAGGRIDLAANTSLTLEDSAIVTANGLTGGTILFIVPEEGLHLSGTISVSGSMQSAMKSSRMAAQNALLPLALFVITVEGITVYDKVYDGTTTAELNYSNASVLGLLGGLVATVGGGTATFNNKNAGNNKPVTVSSLTILGIATGLYVLSPPTNLTGNILPKEINVNGVTAQNKVYDGTKTATLNFSSSWLDGVIAGDTVYVASLSAEFADKNVGTNKAITLLGGTLGGADALNYRGVLSTPFTASITPKAVSVSNLSAQNKVYDGTTAALVNVGSAVLSGVLGGDQVVFSSATASFANKNAGAGKAVTVTSSVLSGTDAGNYIVTGTNAMTATITPKTLTVTGAVAQDKVYNASAVATINWGSASLSGVVSGDTVSLVTSGASASFANKNVGTGKAVTVTGASLSGGDAGNYVLTQPVGLTARITQAVLTVSNLSAQSKIYDATSTAVLNIGGATLGGVFSGDQVSLSSGTASFADKNVGNGKAVTVASLLLGGGDAGNYTVSLPLGLTANITPKTLTITGVTALSRTYNGTNVAGLSVSGLTLQGVVAGDTLSASGGTGTFADKNVGTNKAVTVSGFVVTGSGAGNYTLVQPTGLTATITRANITLVGAHVLDKVYDGFTAATVDLSGASLSGVFAGDNLVLGTAVARFNDVNAGTNKPITLVSLAYSGSGASNYVLLATFPVTASITPRPVTVANISAQSKVYDGGTAATLNLATASLSGVLGGDAVALATGGAVASFADKNVGTDKSITVSGMTLTGAAAGNYVVVQPASLKASITPASVTLTGVVAQDKVYDGLLAAGLNVAGAALTGVVSGDVVSWSGGAGAFTDKNVGAGKTVLVSGFVLSGGDASNYVLVQPAGLSASITPATLTLSNLQVFDKVYDGTDIAHINCVSAIMSGHLATDTVHVVAGSYVAFFSDKNVGSGKSVTLSSMALGGADAGNYVLALPTGLTASITPATLSVSGILALDKVYDGTVSAAFNFAGAGLNGTFSSDDVLLNFAGASGAFLDKNAGTGKGVSLTGLSLSGLDAGNYVLTQPLGLSASITPKTLTVGNVSAQNKSYDGTRVAVLDVSGASLLGAIGGDAVSLSTLAAAGLFDTANAGTGKAVGASGFSLTGNDAGNYVLTQPQGLVADITAAGLTISGVFAQNKIYDGTSYAVLDSSLAALVGLESGANVQLVTSGASGSFADKMAGEGKSVTVSGFTLSGSDANNYTLIQPLGVTATISARSISISGISAQNKIYDGTTQAALVTSGAVLANVLGGDAVLLDGGIGTFENKNVGTSKIVSISGLSLSGADAGNYVLLAAAPVTASITPKDVTVTGMTAENKVYDGTRAAHIVTDVAVLSGVVFGDTVSMAGGDGIFVDKNVGTEKVVEVSGIVLLGADAGNYALVHPADVKASITPATLSVTGTLAADKIYNGTTDVTLDTAASVLAGLLGTDAVVLSKTGVTGAFADRNAGAGKTVLLSGFALDGADAGNYVLVQPADVKASIFAKTVTVADLGVNNKVYDSSVGAVLNSGAASLVGGISGDAVALDFWAASASFADKNVGSGKAVSVSGIALSGADAGNYELLNPTGLTASITPASLSVTDLFAQTKIYDGNAVAALNGAGAVLAGLYSGDAVALDFSGVTALFSDKNAGAGKNVSVSGLALSGGDAGNYILSPLGAVTGTITQASLTAAGISASDKVYDGATGASLNTAGAYLTGLVSGDVVVLETASGSGAFADKNAGTNKAVLLSGFSISGADADNYVFVQPADVTASITPLALTVSGLEAYAKIYDGGTGAILNPAGALLEGLVSGDAVVLAGGVAAFTDKHVGVSKSVSVNQLYLSGTDAGNYTVTLPSGLTAEIVPMEVNISGLVVQSKVYDGTNAAFINLDQAVLTGVAGADHVIVTGAVASYDNKNVGAGKSVTVTGLTLEGDDAANYILLTSLNLTGAITPAEVTLTGVMALNKIYDGTLGAALDSSGAALAGVLGGETVSFDLAGLSGSFTDANAGIGKAVLLSGANLTGGDAGNYVLRYASTVSATITPKTLSVTGLAAQDKIYDATRLASLDAGGVLLVGLLVGDDATLDLSHAQALFDTKNAGIGKSVSLTGLALGGADAGNYILDTVGGLTASVTPKTLSYDILYHASLYGAPSWGQVVWHGLYAGDEVLPVFALYNAASQAVPLNAKTLAGTYTQKVAAIQGADAANYVLAQGGGVHAVFEVLGADELRKEESLHPLARLTNSWHEEFMKKRIAGVDMETLDVRHFALLSPSSGEETHIVWASSERLEHGVHVHKALGYQKNWLSEIEHVQLSENASRRGGYDRMTGFLRMDPSYGTMNATITARDETLAPVQLSGYLVPGVLR